MDERVKEIKAWKTSDDRTWFCEKEARQEQAKLNLKHALKHEFDLLHAGPVERPHVNFDLLVAVLAENPARFAELLTAYAKEQE